MPGPLADRLEALEDGDVARRRSCPPPLAAFGFDLLRALRRLPWLSPLSSFQIAHAPTRETPTARAAETTRRRGPSGRVGAHVQVHIRIPGAATENRADVTKYLQITHERPTPRKRDRRRRRRLLARVRLVTGRVGGEPQALDATLRARVEPLEQLVLHQIELLGPGRRAAGDRDHALALGDRLGLGRDRRAARLAPTPPAPRRAASAAQRRSSDVASAPPAARRGAPAAGHAARARRADPARHAAVADRDLRALGSRRELRRLGRRDQRLAARRASRAESSSRRSGSSSLITSSRSISGGVRRRLEQRLALGEQQRQQRRALLALRAVAPQRAAVERDRDLVEVRPVAVYAAREVGVAPLAQLGGELARRRSPRLRGR